MGSGKGKTKRVRVTKTGKPRTTQALRWDEDKWGTWVSSAGVASISVSEYYLGKIKKSPNDEEAIFIVREVFADAVKCGALKLPTGLTEKDYELTIKYPYMKQRDFELCAKNKQTGSVGTAYSPFLESRKNMFTEGKYILRDIGNAIANS